jgi:hypothetical protein
MRKTLPVQQTCQCLCGESEFQVSGVPLARFVCHCTICQTFTGGPFSEVVAFWARAIRAPAKFPVVFKKYRLPPNVSRGSCQGCGKPVVEFMRIAPLVRVAFVPIRNMPSGETLPRVGAHIFYDRRTQDVDDSIPKFSRYWASELAVSRLLFRGIAGQG